MSFGLSRRALSLCLRCWPRRKQYALRQVGNAAALHRVLTPGENTSHAFGETRRHAHSSAGELEENVRLEGEEADDEANAEHSRPYTRTEHNGHRQRETRAVLQSMSMGKPFEVTIMHDIPEIKREQTKHELSLRLNDFDGEYGTNIASADPSTLLSERETSLKDIIQSIESLRPAATILDDADVARLTHALEKSYNSKQLSSYLRHAIQDSVAKNDNRPKQTSSTSNNTTPRRMAWQPGRSPLSERRSRQAISNCGNAKTKRKLISKIIHMAWNVSSFEEQRSIGELEIFLQDWQLKYLFDLSINGKALYHALIEADLLRQRVHFDAHRPSKVLRIIGTRQDAEEAADHVQLALQATMTIELACSRLRRLVQRPGWSPTFPDIWNNSVRSSIERQTLAIVELEDGRFKIHGTQTAADTAHRLLLSWLDLPHPRSVETFAWEMSQKIGKEPADEHLLPTSEGNANLHFRYRNVTLGRLENAVPRKKVQGPPDSDSDKEHSGELAHEDFSAPDLTRCTCAEALTARLSDMSLELPFQEKRLESTRPLTPQTIPIRSSPWTVDICTLLRPTSHAEGASNPNQANSIQPVVQAQIPHINTVVSHLGLAPAHVNVSRMVAHFIPSPYTNLGLKTLSELPTISVHYTATSPPTLTAAVLHILSQQVLVPLPREAVDLRFSREVTAKLRKEDAANDFLDFTTALQTVPGNGLSLAVPHAVKVRLPLSVLPEQTAKWRKRVKAGSVEIDYLFERFERVQSIDFAPKDDGGSPDTTHLQLGELFSVSDSAMSVRYTERNGGAIGGRDNTLCLRSNMRSSHWKELHSAARSAADPKDNVEAQAYHEHASKLVNSALILARAFTRVSNGELMPHWLAQQQMG